MQIYGLRLFNFLRYGEINNSVVFDITNNQKDQIAEGTETLDKLFETMKENPVGCINKVKEMGISGIMGISGAIDGNEDKSNGVGKSAVLEGICYALFGKIVRRNVNTDKTEGAGKSIVTKINGNYPPELKESYVEIIFEEQDKIYRLKRGRSFSKSQKSDQPVLEFECYNAEDVDSQTSHRTGDTDEALSKVINMDYDVFVNSVMFGQSDAGKFLTGTDKTRKEMLVSLLHLENVVHGCLENVRSRKSNKNQEIEMTQGEIQAIEKIILNSIPTESLKEEWLKGEKTLSDVVRDGTLKLESDIKSYQNSIVALDEESKKVDKEIATLSNSEILNKIDSIKVEGKRVKEERNNKTEQMEAQAKQWKDLYAISKEQVEASSKRLEQLNIKKTRYTEEISNKTKEIENFNDKDCNDILEKAKKAREVKSKYVDGIESFRNKIQELMSEISVFKTHKNLAETAISGLKSQLVEGQNKFICSQCKSEVTREHIEKEVAELNVKIKQAESDEKSKLEEKNVIDEKLKEANNRLNKINEIIEKETLINKQIDQNNYTKKELIKAQEELEEINKSMISSKEEIDKAEKQQEECKNKALVIKNQFSDDISKLESLLDKLRSDLIKAEEDAKDVKSKISTLESSLKEITSKKAEANNKIGAINNQIKEGQSRLSDAVSLKDKIKIQQKELHRLLLLEEVFGLDGIQTRIVKKYLPLLNIYIKEFLDILSEGEMRVQMLINEKGKVDLIIDGGQADTFPMLSGGEKMIVRLAVDIGLALLSFSRCAQKPEMICLDEIFGPLDNSHTEAVFRLLATLKDKFSRVLVISHKTEINELISNKIIIEKGSGSLGLSEIKKII